MIYLWYMIFAICFCDTICGSMTQAEYSLLLSKSLSAKKSKSLIDIDISEEYSQQMNNTHQYGLPICQQCRHIGIIGAGKFVCK
jgi:hypothetical protein